MRIRNFIPLLVLSSLIASAQESIYNFTIWPPKGARAIEAQDEEDGSIFHTYKLYSEATTATVFVSAGVTNTRELAVIAAKSWVKTPRDLRDIAAEISITVKTINNDVIHSVVVASPVGGVSEAVIREDSRIFYVSDATVEEKEAFSGYIANSVKRVGCRSLDHAPSVYSQHGVEKLSEKRADWPNDFNQSRRVAVEALMPLELNLSYFFDKNSLLSYMRKRNETEFFELCESYLHNPAEFELEYKWLGVYFNRIFSDPWRAVLAPPHHTHGEPQ